eukprot:5451503-Heterocapsa_arctica.AAC.1
MRCTPRTSTGSRPSPLPSPPACFTHGGDGRSRIPSRLPGLQEPSRLLLRALSSHGGPHHLIGRDQLR